MEYLKIGLLYFISGYIIYYGIYFILDIFYDREDIRDFIKWITKK